MIRIRRMVRLGFRPGRDYHRDRRYLDFKP